MIFPYISCKFSRVARNVGFSALGELASRGKCRKFDMAELARPGLLAPGVKRKICDFPYITWQLIKKGKSVIFH